MISCLKIAHKKKKYFPFCLQVGICVFHCFAYVSHDLDHVSESVVCSYWRINYNIECW